MIVTLEGRGLHSGAACAVHFRTAAGPVRVRQGANECPIAELVVVDTTRSTTVAGADGRIRIATVEHLFAALGAAGVREGLVVEVEGPEVPLLDGSAASFVCAIDACAVPPSLPGAIVSRPAVFDVGPSRYVFEPSSSSRVEVRIDFQDDRLVPHAAWNGELARFREGFATARTFAFERDLGDLLARGLAAHVSPRSVVVIADDRVHFAGMPFSPDEPARHKLLDLLGDLYLHGGPPRGHVTAFRPGHTATHEALRRARRDGVLAQT